MSVWHRRFRWWLAAVVLIAAAPLPVTAAGILFAERGATPSVLAILAVTAVTAAACLCGGSAAVHIAVHPGSRKPEEPDRASTTGGIDAARPVRRVDTRLPERSPAIRRR